jgi:hypothetical protein
MNSLGASSGQARQHRRAASPTGEQRSLDRSRVAVITANEQVISKVNSLFRRMRWHVIGLGMGNGVSAQMPPIVDSAAPPGVEFLSDERFDMWIADARAGCDNQGFAVDGVFRSDVAHHSGVQHLA